MSHALNAYICLDKSVLIVAHAFDDRLHSYFQDIWVVETIGSYLAYHISIIFWDADSDIAYESWIIVMIFFPEDSFRGSNYYYILFT